jgi:Zn-dependent M28 family amino/carboxypeptidase
MTRATRIAPLLVLLAAPLTAQNAAVRATAERAITQADLLRDVSYIASDALRGRATPSPGFDSAAAYIVRELKALGVKPFGDNGGYFQHYPLAHSVLDTAATTVTVGGKALVWGRDYRVTSFVAPGPREGAVLYVGQGLRVPARGIDPYAGHEVRGKWLLVHPRTGPARALTTDTLGILGVDYTTVQEEARARGALGIITISTNSMPTGGRGGAVQSRDLVPSVGRAYAPYPLPQISVGSAALDWFVGDAKGATQLTNSPAYGAYPGSFVLGTGALRVNLVATTNTIRPYNVVGFIEGSDPTVKDEWIAMAAHLDGAVGRGVNAAGDSIFNAADDNASGSAGALAITRALMQGPRPRRSILLIWDSGEETGLWGARHIAYGDLGKKIVAIANVDMIGRSRAPGTNILGEDQLTPPGVIYITGPRVLSTRLEEVVMQVEKEYPWIAFDRSSEDPNHESFYPRTDASPYVESGIPYLGVRNGRHGDYHRQTDEVSKLDIAKMEATSRALYAMLWHAADGAVRPRMDKPLPKTLWFVTPR